VITSKTHPLSPPRRLLGVDRGHQNAERKALRGEPFSAGASSFAGPGIAITPFDPKESAPEAKVIVMSSAFISLCGVIALAILRN
jgi:hypothetical protein